MLKRSILAVSCLLILGSAWSASAAVDPTLVGWWWFDEGGGTTAADSSGNKNNGALMNGAPWGTGKFGKAVQLDGVDDYVQIPHSTTLCVSNEVTVMAWINTPRLEYPGAGYQGIVSKGNAPRSTASTRRRRAPCTSASGPARLHRVEQLGHGDGEPVGTRLRHGQRRQSSILHQWRGGGHRRRRQRAAGDDRYLGRQYRPDGRRGQPLLRRIDR